MPYIDTKGGTIAVDDKCEISKEELELLHEKLTEWNKGDIQILAYQEEKFDAASTLAIIKVRVF